MLSIDAKRETVPTTASNESMEVENPLTAFQSLLKEATDLMLYPEPVYQLLKDPIRFLEVKIPVRMDDGKTL